LGDGDNDDSPMFGPEGFEGHIEYADWRFDDADLLLIAMLKDPVLAPEFCWSNPNNTEYGGCYRVRDYQYKFNREDDHYAIFACARSVGKTEREKIWAFNYYFRRAKQDLFITAPQLIHLLPLADAIESVIEGCRLLRECLDRSRQGKTGFGHNPFSVDYADGTKIVARIPNLDGKGVKGIHSPELIVEEGQDYPDAGYLEVHETVMKEVEDFKYHIYGVHRGSQGGGFAQRAQGSDFTLHKLTAIQRPGWGVEEKSAAIAAYGGTSSPDYRRNILGEPGSASSPIFVVARLMACIDQNRSSEYNTRDYVAQTLRWEDVKDSGLSLSDVVDLPPKRNGFCVAGVDIGLTNSPTVCSVFQEIRHGRGKRLALMRRYTLERFTSPQIREFVRVLYGWNTSIHGIGLDITGLGFPIFQELTEGEVPPPNGLVEAVRGWKFNEKIVVGHDTDHNGKRVDVKMAVIEATTRYLRQWVDSGYLLLPFDREVTSDLLAEHTQRVSSVARLSGNRKPNAFHILDSFRMAALVAQDDVVTPQEIQHGPVFDIAFDPGRSGYGY